MKGAPALQPSRHCCRSRTSTCVFDNLKTVASTPLAVPGNAKAVAHFFDSKFQIADSKLEIGVAMFKIRVADLDISDSCADVRDICGRDEGLLARPASVGLSRDTSQDR